MPEGEVIRRGWFCCHFPAKWGVPTWFSLTPRVGKRIRDPSCAVTGVGIQVPQQASTAWPSAEEAAYYFSPLDSVDSVRWGLLAVWELPPDYQLGFGVEAPHVTFNDNTGEEPFCCPSGGESPNTLLSLLWHHYGRGWASLQLGKCGRRAPHLVLPTGCGWGCCFILSSLAEVGLLSKHLLSY